MTRRAIGRVTAGFLLLASPVMAAELPTGLISSFRLKHGEVRVVRDATRVGFMTYRRSRKGPGLALTA